MYRFLKVIFLLIIGNSLGNLLNRLQLNGTLPDVPVAKRRRRYSLKSDRLWEDGPLNAELKFVYKSKLKNKINDPVFYKTGDDPLLVKPAIRPGIAGYFSAYPRGLDIDRNTGEIDINNSNTGIRYTIEFTPCGQEYVARTAIVICGIFYQGKISSISGEKMVASSPYYFGHGPNWDVPSEKTPDGKFGYIPDGIRPTANLNGLVIDSATGIINLEKTITNGALGFREGSKRPENGTSKEFKIYYQLNTAEQKGVINYTSLRIHYFNTKDDIPDELLVRIRQQKNSVFKINVYAKGFGWPVLFATHFSWSDESPLSVIGALLGALSSFLFLNAESDNPLRPPEEIIIG